MAGHKIVIASWTAVAIFGVTALLDAAGVDALDGVAAGVALGLFLCSLPVWVYGFGLALVRSARGDEIGVGGLFFLSGSAPTSVRRHLLGALAVSVLIAAVTAAADPFGVLVPMLPLGLAGLWGARYGVYPPRPEPSASRGSGRTVPKGGRR